MGATINDDAGALLVFLQLFMQVPQVQQVSRRKIAKTEIFAHFDVTDPPKKPQNIRASSLLLIFVS